MIKSLYIDNFKALNDFQIDFQAVTLLIGANSVGKSSILQAMELLAFFTRGKEAGELNNYLKQQNWLAKDIRSTLSKKRNIRFKLSLEINGQDFIWEVVLKSLRVKLLLVSELISSGEKKYLSRTANEAFAKNSAGDVLPLVDKSFVSSGLSLMDEQLHGEKFPDLIAIKIALNGLALFDFSATNQLKSTNVLNHEVKIGRHGENLAAFLYQLPKKELEELAKAIRIYAPFFESLRVSKKRNNEVEIDIKESFSNSFIEASHLSDGMMRLLGILTLALTDSGYQILLIEEIEDGINPNLAGEVIKTLIKVAKDSQKQFILTTHNPLILDWVPVESINFLYRTKDGQVKHKSFKDSPVVLQNLDYMNPGEIWINFTEKELLDENITP